MSCKSVLGYVAIVFVFLGVALMPHAGNAGVQSGLNHYIDGAEDYDAGLYESALSSLGKAIDLEPSNLDYQYYYAMTYAALEQYQEAEAIYRAILKLDAKNYYKAYFDLARIYMKKNDYKKAMKTLSAAEWIVPDNARLYLKKGVISRKMKQYKAAVDNLTRAVELNPKLSQVVNYNLGLIYFGQKRNAKAKKSFGKVIAEKPDNQLADYARQALERLETAEKPWKVKAYLSYSYDDNLSEDPLDLPGHLSSLADDKDGQYQLFFLKGEYRVVKLRDFQFSGGYQMTYINFNDSEHENSFKNSPYVLMHYSMKPVYLSLKYTVAHYFADSDERQIQHKIRPSMVILEPHNMKSVISFMYQMKDYKSDAPIEDVNIWTAQVTQYFELPDFGMTPRIRLKYGDEDSDATVDTYSYFETSVGIEARLPFGLTGDFSISDIRTDFKKNFGIKRKDTGYLIETSLKKEINKTLSVGLYYGYTHNQSNVTDSSLAVPVYSYDPYKYDQNHVRLFFSMDY